MTGSATIAQIIGKVAEVRRSDAGHRENQAEALRRDLRKPGLSAAERERLGDQLRRLEGQRGGYADRLDAVVEGTAALARRFDAYATRRMDAAGASSETLKTLRQLYSRAAEATGRELDELLKQIKKLEAEAGARGDTMSLAEATALANKYAGHARQNRQGRADALSPREYEEKAAETWKRWEAETDPQKKQSLEREAKSHEEMAKRTERTNNDERRARR